MAKEMQQGEKLEGDDDDEGDGDDLSASIARWMSEQDGRGAVAAGCQPAP